MTAESPDYDDIDGTGEVSVRAVEIARKTMTGDLRDALLQLFKDRQKPWAQMTEAEQRSAAAVLESACFNATRRAVGIIAADGRKAISATLKKAVVKDGAIEGTVVLSRHDEQRHALFDAQGSSIIITIADAEAYSGERKPAEVQPDQPDMLAGEDGGGGDQEDAPADAATGPGQDVRTSPDFIGDRADGATAFVRGKDPADAPYAPDTAEGRAWLCGYYRAEGLKAYAEGLSVNDCPYEIGTPAAEDWDYGWAAEAAKDKADGQPPPIAKHLRRTKGNGATTGAAGHA